MCTTQLRWRSSVHVTIYVCIHHCSGSHTGHATTQDKSPSGTCWELEYAPLNYFTLWTIFCSPRVLLSRDGFSTNYLQNAMYIEKLEWLDKGSFSKGMWLEGLSKGGSWLQERKVQGHLSPLLLSASFSCFCSLGLLLCCVLITLGLVGWWKKQGKTWVVTTQLLHPSHHKIVCDTMNEK